MEEELINAPRGKRGRVHAARSAHRAQKVSPHTSGRLEAAASPVPALEEQPRRPFSSFRLIYGTPERFPAGAQSPWKRLRDPAEVGASPCRTRGVLLAAP